MTDILAKDSAAEQQIQIFSPMDIKEFFGSFPYLNEYFGDERLDFRELKDFKISDLKVDFVHNIYYDTTQADLLLLLETLRANNFKGNFILASDYEVYGYKTAKQVPLDERAECTRRSQIKALWPQTKKMRSKRQRAHHMVVSYYDSA